MKTYAPDYYPKFRCIAGKCRHSCCIGWEIDIDEQTFNRYQNTEGDFGVRLMKNISQSDAAHYFKLCPNDRCPFLNTDNLCDIIINLGEDALCRICSDHPRFRNYFSDRIEIGLGLCCEAAAELVLSNSEKVSLKKIKDGHSHELTDEDEYFLNLRQKYIDILQNRKLPLAERFSELLLCAGATVASKNASEWADIYLSLEHLDSKWVKVLKKIKNKGTTPLILNKKWETALEQLAVYFIIRHLADGRYDMSFSERVSFAVLSTLFVSTVFSLCCDNSDFLSLADVARMYSSEIEYSEENTEALLDICAENNFSAERS